MNDYGRGGILGASVLPATSAIELVLVNHADPIIVIGILLVSVLSFVNLIGQISRFTINAHRYEKESQE